MRASEGGGKRIGFRGRRIGSELNHLGLVLQLLYDVEPRHTRFLDAIGRILHRRGLEGILAALLHLHEDVHNQEIVCGCV